MRTDGQTGMTRLTVAFCDFAKAPRDRFQFFKIIFTDFVRMGIYLQKPLNVPVVTTGLPGSTNYYLLRLSMEKGTGWEILHYAFHKFYSEPILLVSALHVALTRETRSAYKIFVEVL